MGPHLCAQSFVNREATREEAEIGVVRYARQKAAEVAAAASGGAVEELAAAACDSAKEYTARKMEEKERELEANKKTEEKKSTKIAERGEGQEKEGGGKRGSEERTFQGGFGKTDKNVARVLEKQWLAPERPYF
ncbi:hypothetical protein PIB30_035279 [Stylosanthes scabra]|uniref:Uncharacterized protein n=1 Tax=Stylosanthes scabra TaxID=79078 RepID=A0ABU6XD65_9FABA|nr:hypothetical protein [Stylosanthes scabra]